MEDFTKVKDVFREALERRFGKDVVFKEIYVHRTVENSDCLRIFVIYEGDPKALKIPWTVELVNTIRPKLFHAGIDELPIPSFVPESEWDQVHAGDSA